MTLAKKPQATAKKDPAAASEKAEARAAKIAAARKAVKAATGSDVEPLQDRLVTQALAGVWLPEGKNKDDAFMATLAALQAIAPTDGLEGMLAAQMVTTHEAAMECLRRAMISGQTFEGRDSNLKHGAKLMQIYTRQMEALAKHRGRGQQKITVEHVNVHAGGQAIVGNVNGSAPSLSKAAPRQRALSDAPDGGVPLPDELATPAREKQRARKSRK